MFWYVVRRLARMPSAVICWILSLLATFVACVTQELDNSCHLVGLARLGFDCCRHRVVFLALYVRLPTEQSGAEDAHARV